MSVIPIHRLPASNPRSRVPRALSAVPNNNTVAIEGMTDAKAIFVGTVGLGTPPQYVQLVLDTGSRLLAVVSGNYCRSCSESYPSSCLVQSTCTARSTYNFVQSSTYLENCSPGVPKTSSGLCELSCVYADGSAWLGFEYQDVVTFGQLSTPAEFAAIYLEYKDFTTVASSGIFGLGLPTPSVAGPPPVLTQLLQNNNKTDTFSMCLGNNPGHEEDYQAGYMLLGQNASGELC